MTKKSRLESFWEWAEKERGKRNLSWRSVEKRGGVGNATVSRRANNMSNPTVTVCEALARAFNIPKEQVFRRAGLLPSLPDEKSEERELLYQIKELDANGRARVAEFVRYLMFEKDQRHRNAPNSPDRVEAAP